MNLAISSPHQSTPRLATLNAIARGLLESDETGRYNYIDTIRSFIRGNLQSPHKYNVASASSRANDKRIGHTLSTRIATIKKHPKDIEFAFQYISLIHQMNEAQAMRFEPSFVKAREKMRSGEWQAIRLTGINANIEGDHLEKFDRFNFIYNLHFSVSEPSLVAYYPSLEHMRRQKETKLRFGKFLTNIKDEIGIESESIIKSYVDSYNAILEARNGWKLDFIGSNDREGWLNVYRDDRHVNSCMSDCDSVKLYAHDLSVLRLAYLSDRDDHVLARCIVRDDVKEYIRVYPAPENSTTGKWLQSLLIDQGYKHGTLNDVLIKTFDSDEGYKAPYIDRGNSSDCQFADLETIDGKLYFRIGNSGNHHLVCTNGFDREIDEYDDNSVYCEWCGDYHHEDDTRYHDHLGYSVCDGCADNNGVHAINENGDQEFIHLDDAFYCESDSEYYTRDARDEKIIIDDDLSGDYFLADEMIETSIEGVWIHRENAITPIIEYVRSHTTYKSGVTETHFQNYIDVSEARFLPNGEAIHFTQYDDMIGVLNSYKIESEAIDA